MARGTVFCVFIYVSKWRVPMTDHLLTFPSLKPRGSLLKRLQQLLNDIPWNVAQMLFFPSGIIVITLVTSSFCTISWKCHVYRKLDLWITNPAKHSSLVYTGSWRTIACQYIEINSEHAKKHHYITSLPATLDQQVNSGSYKRRLHAALTHLQHLGTCAGLLFVDLSSAFDIIMTKLLNLAIGDDTCRWIKDLTNRSERWSRLCGIAVQ